MKTSIVASPGVLHAGYFSAGAKDIDPVIAQAIAGEYRRHQDGIKLITSENIELTP